MTSLLFHYFTLLGLGFTLGLKHAVDTDHVVAVSTIVSQTRSVKKSMLAGLSWGLGHTNSLFLAGWIIMGLGFSIPEKFAIFFEFMVGVMLVILGFDALWKAKRDNVHLHGHHHGNMTHIHLHSHKTSVFHGHTHKSFLVGLVHGLAGSAALLFLVLTTTKSIGSILGMLIMGAAISLPFIFSSKLTKLNMGIRVFSGLASVVFGVITMQATGFIGI